MSTRRFSTTTRGAAGVQSPAFGLGQAGADGSGGGAGSKLLEDARSGNAAAQKKLFEAMQNYRKRNGLDIGLEIEEVDGTVTIEDAGITTPSAGGAQTTSIAEMIRRDQIIGGARYHWFAESNLDAGAKMLLVVLTVISVVAMFYPYGLTAGGWTFVSPIFGFILPAVLVLFYLLALALTLFDRRFFNANFRWILSSTMEPRYRISDRWFSLFNSLIGLLWNLAIFLLWLTFYLNNMSVTSKASLLGASGFVTEPYAGLAAVSFFGYWSIAIVFLVTLYSNIASRENRDIMQRLTRLFHSKSLEDVILKYETAARGEQV